MGGGGWRQVKLGVGGRKWVEVGQQKRAMTHNGYLLGGLSVT